MTDYSVLVERLRAKAEDVAGGLSWCNEAADAIEALVSQLDAETKLHLENESRHMALAMGWKNRIERLEGALQSLYDNEKYDDDDPRLGCARDLARAALKEKP